MKIIFPAIVIIFTFVNCQRQSEIYYVASASDSAGIGLSKVSLFSDGTMAVLEQNPILKTCSYFTIKDNNLLAIGRSQKNRAVLASFRTGEKLILRDTISLPGKGSCHVSYHSIGYAMVANYSSGDINLFKINEGGQFTGDILQYELVGSGPDSTRQRSSHPHQITQAPESDLIMVPDLGSDKIWTFLLSKDNKLKPAPIPYASTQPGAGPRHLTYTGDGKLVILNELNATATLYSFDALSGITDKLSTVNLLVDAFDGLNKSADIVYNKSEKKLYASNRGPNTVTTISLANDKLEVTDYTACGGEWPRAMRMDPNDKFLLVANRYTNNVAIFSTEHKLKKIGDLSVADPLCVRFVHN